MALERYIKKQIRAVLDTYGEGVYYFMPVPGGYGRSTIDYLGFAHGLGFAIEAKRSKGRPTERQDVIIAAIRASGARVFVINDQTGIDELNGWLKVVTHG